MDWMWDEKKNAENKRKHGISFETAQLVFDDPFMISLPDHHPDEERWQTLGIIGHIVVLVVHAGEDTRRIISARKATSHERRAYEENNFKKT